METKPKFSADVLHKIADENKVKDVPLSKENKEINKKLLEKEVERIFDLLQKMVKAGEVKDKFTAINLNENVSFDDFKKVWEEQVEGIYVSIGATDNYVIFDWRKSEPLSDEIKKLFENDLKERELKEKTEKELKEKEVKEKELKEMNVFQKLFKYIKGK